ncbi:hypothetical protein MSPP1_000509 [Malassezia sp. CBS 17886]|nr:hypothetical protein MSPP1_000509 [Malassezia sp. CBS 17886]
MDPSEHWLTAAPGIESTALFPDMGPLTPLSPFYRTGFPHAHAGVPDGTLHPSESMANPGGALEADFDFQGIFQPPCPGDGVDMMLPRTDAILGDAHRTAAAGKDAELPADTSQVSVLVPLVLAPPTIEANTNPFVHLPDHLDAHGLDIEASEFRRTNVSCEFVLEAFVSMHTGAAAPLPSHVASAAGEQLLALLDAAMQSLNPHLRGQVTHYAQLGARSLPSHKLLLPASVQLPCISNAKEGSDAVPMLPTHLLAVCPLARAGHPRTEPAFVLMAPDHHAHVVDAPCTLVPVHWLIYVLQCAHLPHAPRAADDSASDALDSGAQDVPAADADVPFVVLSVPYPQHWAIIHRWLYTRDAGKLLATLLPLGVVIAAVPSTRDVSATQAIEALAGLSLAALLRIAVPIRGTWHNAHRIGIFSSVFWTTLSRAWDIVVAAIVLRKARMSQGSAGDDKEE